MTEPLDRVIEDVARSLTAGEPRPDFRARVLDRVTAADARRWPAATAWGFRAAAGAAAIAIVAMVGTLTRAPRGPQTAADLARHTEVAGIAPGAAAAVTPATYASRSVAVRPSRARSAARAPALVEWRARAVPALIQPEALSVSQLSVAPLGIAPMVIEPIGDGGR